MRVVSPARHVMAAGEAYGCDQKGSNNAHDHDRQVFPRVEVNSDSFTAIGGLWTCFGEVHLGGRHAATDEVAQHLAMNARHGGGSKS